MPPAKKKPLPMMLLGSVLHFRRNQLPVGGGGEAVSVSASSLNGLLSTLLSILLLKLPRSLSRGVKAFNGDCKELAAGCGAGLVTRPNEELSESARRCGARLVTRPNEELGDGARFAPDCGTGLVTLPNEVLSDGARCGLKSLVTVPAHGKTCKTDYQTCQNTFLLLHDKNGSTFPVHPSSWSHHSTYTQRWQRPSLSHIVDAGCPDEHKVKICLLGTDVGTAWTIGIAV